MKLAEGGQCQVYSTLSRLMGSVTEGAGCPEHRRILIGGAGCQTRQGHDRRGPVIGRPGLRALAAQRVRLNALGAGGVEGIISMDHLSRWLPTQQRRTQDGVSTCWISGSPRLRLS